MYGVRGSGNARGRTVSVWGRAKGRGCMGYWAMVMLGVEL